LGRPKLRRTAIFAAELTFASAAVLSGEASARDAAAVAAGGGLVETHCAPCHGENLSNPNGIADLRQLRPEDRGRFNQTLQQGRGQMPSWAGMFSDAEVDQIWAFIESISN
jgi:mono/diheme cytochrome c family protein